MLTGCDLAGTKAVWIAGQGGEVSRASGIDRAIRASRQLPRVAVTDHLSFHILASDDARAYSWPDGSIYITRGLMNLLDDDELAAAIAHERGHLTNSGEANAIVGLHGCDKNLEVEIHADAAGTELLRSSGIPRSTMARMLQKVHDAANISPACRQEIQRRIQILSAPAISKNF